MTEFAIDLDSVLRAPIMDSLNARFPPKVKPNKITSLLPNSNSKKSNYTLPKALIDYKHIFQTNKTLSPDAIKIWNEKNRLDGWDVMYFDDWQGDKWVKDTFNGTKIQWAWDFMTRPVLKADFLRHMLPLVLGGVYVDVDVSRRPVFTVEAHGC